MIRDSGIRKKSKRLKYVGTFLVFGSALTIFLIIVVVNVGKQQEFGAPQKIVLELVGVAQRAVTGFSGFFSDRWQSYISLWDVREENKRLRDEVQRYKALNAEFREALATNVRLEKLLELKESLPPPTITARIIGRDPSIWYRTIIIDRGSSHGVQRGMPVVCAEGVVGQVMNTSPHFCKVLLANDPNSATEAIVQENRAQGIVKGKSEDLYELQYVLKSYEITMNDHVVTSGMGGVFPKGIPIGTISQVISNPTGMFQRIDVKPSVNFSQLEYVIIIMKENSLTE